MVIISSQFEAALQNTAQENTSLLKLLHLSLDAHPRLEDALQQYDELLDKNGLQGLPLPVATLHIAKYRPPKPGNPDALIRYVQQTQRKNRQTAKSPHQNTRDTTFQALEASTSNRKLNKKLNVDRNSSVIFLFDALFLLGLVSHTIPEKQERDDNGCFTRQQQNLLEWSKALYNSDPVPCAAALFGGRLLLSYIARCINGQPFPEPIVAMIRDITPTFVTLLLHSKDYFQQKDKNQLKNTIGSLTAAIIIGDGLSLIDLAEQKELLDFLTLLKADPNFNTLETKIRQKMMMEVESQLRKNLLEAKVIQNETSPQSSSKPKL